ncbi:MAG TPA: hypothetical protein VFR39_00745 [Burkholderiales bacterium]|nr:hypothetical protein [Burkholderiales bacterium]
MVQARGALGFGGAGGRPGAHGELAGRLAGTAVAVGRSLAVAAMLAVASYGLYAAFDLIGRRTDSAFRI